MTDLLRYPIGPFEPPMKMTEADVQRYIADIEALPEKLTMAVEGLIAEQLDTPYRPGGWTIRQVVHHLPDSHMNSYIRFKWALTEVNPMIKAYDEVKWAELPEAISGEIDMSLALLKALHKRWVAMLKGLDSRDHSQTFTHPETRQAVRLDIAIALYAWHGEHHLAHIVKLKERMGW